MRPSTHAGRGSKTRSLRIHAKKRAFQRYGIELNRDDLSEIADTIRRGLATFVEKQSWRVSVYDVTVRGELARIVFDHHRKAVVTFLPKEAMQACEPLSN